MFELDYGIAKSSDPVRSRATLDAFLALGFERPDFTAEDAREASDIRAYLEGRGAPIGPYDYLIAAQARRRGAVLVTLNRREFDRVPRLMVTDWGGA
jgi:tRNA(fMet)-specific endonuclease VapC